MDTETIIIISIIVSSVMLPLIILKVREGSLNLSSIFKLRFKREKKSKKISLPQMPLSSTSSKARVLEAMCRSRMVFGGVMRSSDSGLSYGEINILMRKTSPLHTRVFPIREDASQRELNRWLNHPLINCPLPDNLVLDMASYTPVPLKTMEKMLKKLLGKSYQENYRKAEEELESKEH